MPGAVGFSCQGQAAERTKKAAAGGSDRGSVCRPWGTADGTGQSKPSWELESEMARRPEVKCATSGQNLGDRRPEAAVQILVRGHRQANSRARGLTYSSPGFPC